MPPTSNMRKTSLTTNPALDGGAGATKRTASGRAIRTNTTRPTNYYARPFGSLSGPSALATDNDAQDAQDPGFFPALQYFSDAVTALPREVMRQFTLMKEVEAKIHGPNEKLGEILDQLIELPVPSRKVTNTGFGAGQQGGGLISLTASNSAMGSANVSLVNGVGGGHSAHNSVTGSVVGEEESEEDMARRRQYHELRILTHSLLPNLDEKNVVLAEANRVLGLQLLRVDSVLPHLDNEISEAARLGSMTHWAYSDNRQKKTAPAAAPTRRDVVAANSLAAAASAIHETEIAQARRDAGREANREKHKGKRHAHEHVDSEFEERPKKAQTKVGKSKAAAATGLGISTNGEPVKRRKVDKGLAAVGMERTLSGATNKGSKATRETPRSTPAAEPSRKATKAKLAPPPPKKRIQNSAQNSPALASSPLHSSFNASMDPPPLSARPQSARLRQNSTTNLRHERVMEQDSRPTSAAGKANGNSKRKAAHEDGEEQGETNNNEPLSKVSSAGDGMKREDVEMADAGDRPAVSRSNSSKTGKASKTATPREDKFPDVPSSMARTRSTRSRPGNTRDSSMSDEPAEQGPPSKHKRHISNSHLVKQLAPFNRSPDLDRHRDADDDDDIDDEVGELDADEARKAAEDEVEGRSTRRGRSSRPVSRRNTQTAVPAGSPSPAPESHKINQEDDEVEEPEEIEGDADIDSPPPAVEDVPALSPDRDLTPPADDIDDEPADDEPVDNEEDEPMETAADEDEDEEEHDPDDPDEPKYCYCNRGSYGEMVACDNDDCPREWFHIGCTELKQAPEEEEKWYCEECRPHPATRRGKNGRGRGGKR